jgi:hypothetical protein
MAGTSRLVCGGFVETETFGKAKEDLKRLLGLTNREIDDRLEGLLWALRRDASVVSERIPRRFLWVAVTPRGIPTLRIYLRPRGDVEGECELLWIEERA